MPCSTLSTPANATIVLESDGSTTKAVFECDFGSTLKGERTVSCRADGTWDFTEPTCGMLSRDKTCLVGFLMMWLTLQFHGISCIGIICCLGAQWLSDRVSDSGAKGRGFETYLLCVVSLSKTLYSLKVLVIPRKRWLCPDMTETLLTGTLSLTTKQKQKYLLSI